MTHHEWLDQYRSAWIARDADAAGDLFTEDATYREQPFEEALVGRDAIRQYWSTVTRTQSAIELRYGTPLVAGNRVAVEWWANLLNDGSPVTLAGEFMLVFDESGRCRELREYWTIATSRIDPPGGWGA
jgi:uncharacterized protein (TIGR02246 family)